MRLRRNGLRAIGAGVFAAVLLASCGSPSGGGGEEDGTTDGGAEGGAEETVSPSGEAAFTWAITGADQAIHEEVAALWNEQNPDEQVEVAFLAPTADEQRQAMFQDLQSGAGEFDVLGLDVVWTGEFADNEYIVSLEEFRDDVEGANLPGAINSSQWQNELFALPYSSNGGFLYYRTDLVDEAPTTWDEVMEIGIEKGEEAGIGGFVGLGNQYEGFVVNFLQLFWSAGGNLFDEAQENSTFLEGDAAERALQWLTDGMENGLFAKGFDSMVEDDARSLFQSGEAVFMHNWPYAIPLLNGDDGESAVEGKFDFAPLPGFDGNEGVGALGGLNNAVSALSQNPEVAKKFVVWAATSPEAQQILLDHSLPPTLLSAYDDADDQSVEMLGKVLANAEARPPVPGYNSLSLAIQENLHPAYLGQKDPQEALQAVDEAAQKALQG